MVHCPLELMDDDFNLLVDHDQELANRVREAYARELEGTDTVAAAAHFPGLRFGRLLPGETQRAAGPSRRKGSARGRDDTAPSGRGGRARFAVLTFATS